MIIKVVKQAGNENKGNNLVVNYVRMADNSQEQNTKISRVDTTIKCNGSNNWELGTMQAM